MNPRMFVGLGLAGDQGSNFPQFAALCGDADRTPVQRDHFPTAAGSKNGVPLHHDAAQHSEFLNDRRPFRCLAKSVGRAGLFRRNMRMLRSGSQDGSRQQLPHSQRGEERGNLSE